jgi:hypothetical protein
MQVSARIGRGLAVAAGALLMLWPAILNRYPLMYPDSIGYLGDGRPLARILFRYAPKGYPAMRSEFYSLGIFPLHWNLTPWPIVVWQALLTSWVLWLTLRSVLPQRTARRFAATFLILVALLSLLTSVSWYVSLPMPDILGPLLYLAIYLLVFARETLSRGERRALSALAFWAITAHSTHLMLGVGICFLLALLRFWPRNWVPHVSTLRRGFSTTGLAHIALLIAIAIAAQLALHRYLYGHATLNGNHAPYLMARIVADGPGALYLRQHCATLDWAICSDVGHLPDNDDDFLWAPGVVWAGADARTQQRLLAEEMPLVRATLRAYPLQQAARSWANFTQQLNDFGVNDFDNNDRMQQSLAQVFPSSVFPSSAIPSSATSYSRSLQARSIVPTNAFTILERWVVLPSALLLAGLLPWLWRTAYTGRDDRRGLRVKLKGWLRRPVYTGHDDRRGLGGKGWLWRTAFTGRDDRESGYSRQRMRLLGLVVIVGPTLFANAFLTAVLSSSDSRYQARVIWLVPLLAALAALDLLGQRRPRRERPPTPQA